MKFDFSNHPGTPYLIFFTILGMLAGMSRLDDPSVSRLWPLWGALIALGFIGPIYIWGAYRK